MEWLKNNLAIISVYLITVGIVYLTAYYSYFEVNISSYLDLSEIIQLQFKYFAVAFCGIVLINMDVTSKYVSVLSKSEEGEDNIYSELLKPSDLQKSNASKRINAYNKNRFRISVIFICVMILGVFIYKAIKYHYLAFPALEFIAAIVLLYILANFTPKYEVLLGDFGMNKMAILFTTSFAISAISLIVITFEWARLDAFNLITRRSENEITFYLDGKSISTNDSLIFTGKTKNYIFLYNRFTEQSQVYPFSSIKSIEYRPGKEYKNLPHQYKIGK